MKRRQHCRLLKMTVLAEVQSISPPDNETQSALRTARELVGWCFYCVA